MTPPPSSSASLLPLPLALQDVVPPAAESFTPQHVPLPLRYANLIAVVIPLLGVFATAFLLWGTHFNFTQLAIFIGMYIVTAFGITVGYHRLFTHKSFETTPFMKWVIGIAGGMAVEGRIDEWVAVHRCHHQHSDTPRDPHSPNVVQHPHEHLDDDDHPTTVYGTFRGLLHAHVGWIIKPELPGFAKYIPDLMKDRHVLNISKLFPLWVLLSLAIPTVLGALLTDLGAWSWNGALLGFLWGGLARICFVHHITWSINSICHIYGSRPFNSHDHSRNNALFGVLGMGEGWHNNHHAFPTSARHGLFWYQFDASYLFIRSLALIGQAWNIKTPSPTRLASRRAKPQT